MYLTGQEFIQFDYKIIPAYIYILKVINDDDVEVYTNILSQS
jgi:hypothetical protein